MSTPHGHHGHDNSIEGRLARLEASQERVEASVGRIEQSVGLQQAAAERMEKNLMAIAQQLVDVGAKIDKFTTDEAAVIDSAVARILAEMNKPVPDQAAIQAAADHLSTAADNLIAFNLANADKILNAGVPAVVPPTGTVPPPEPPVVAP